jgi:hypothetical protein
MTGSVVDQRSYSCWTGHCSSSTVILNNLELDRTRAVDALSEAVLSR